MEGSGLTGSQIGARMNFLKQLVKDRRISFLLRVILGLIFITASLDKIAHPDQFAKIVYNYHILPPFLINIFAIILPWLELTCGIFLILGLFLESSALLITLLLLIFMMGMGLNLVRGIDINCGCFSTAPTGKSDLIIRLVEDFLMLLAGLQILFYNKRFLIFPRLIKKT